MTSIFKKTSDDSEINKEISWNDFIGIPDYNLYYYKIRISSETFIIRTSIYQKNNPFIITSESIAQLKCKFPQNPESKVSENPIKICFCMKRDITGLAYFVAFILKEELNSPILMTTVQFRFRFRNYIGKVFTNFRSWNQNMIKKRNIIIIKCNRCYGWSFQINR